MPHVKPPTDIKEEIEKKLDNINIDDELDKILETETKRDQTDLDVLKELFKLKEIETKTELNINEIVLINQKRMIADLLGWESLNMALLDYMFLLVSKQRRGREEFVRAFMSEREQKIQQSQGGLFSNIKNKLGFG